MITRTHSRKHKWPVLIPLIFLFLSLHAPAMGQGVTGGQDDFVKARREAQAQYLQRFQNLRREAAPPAVQPKTSAVEPQTDAVPQSGAATPGSSLTTDGPRKGDLITMNFRDVDLQVLVKFMSDLTGKNFVIEPNVKGTMTVLSQEKITAAEAYQVFLSTLDVYGLAAVPAGKVVKIIQATDAKSKGVETFIRNAPRSVGDKIITQVLALKHADAGEMARLLAPLVPKTGLLVPYTDTNTLILIDSESNIRRLTEIMSELDTPDSKGRIYIFDLQYASAKKLAPKLIPLFQKRAGVGAGGVAAGQGVPQSDIVKIFPDERTNSLIVMASPKQADEIRQLLEKLDAKVGKRSAGVHVLTLKYARAEDLAKVLTEIPGKGTQTATDEKMGKEKTPTLSKDVQIYPDKSTNSLIIIADTDEYEILEDIIHRLDVPRTMVFVEALIMEVSATKSLDLGVEWSAAEEYSGGFKQGSNGGVLLGKSAGGADASALATGAIPTALSIGVLGKAITLGGVVFPSYAAFVKSVQSDNNFNILSTPQILTMDNAEAVIEVGQNIPFLTTSSQGTNTLDRALQSYEYKDVGVSLKVTPLISENRTVRLKVEQSIKSVVSSTALGGTVLAPTTTFRRAKTDITVNDGDTAVIGGLIETRMDRGKTQTPCLGNIPALGWLFKAVNDRDEKTNLLVFLSPRIVENREATMKLYDQKRGEIDRAVDQAVTKQQKDTLRRKVFEQD